jgi:hypothetical protein
MSIESNFISCIAFFLAAFSADKTFAQFSDSVNYHFVFSPSGSLNKTKDADAYLLNNAVKLEIKQKRVQLNFNTGWIYGKTNDLLTNNDYTAAFDFNWYQRNPRFYFWGLANYNSSYSLRINNQLLTGLGAAYSFLNQPEAYLNISNGILYDLSELNLIDSKSNYHTYRNSLRLQFRFLIKRIFTVDGGGFWQPSLTLKNDYIIRSNINAGLKLNDWLSLNSSAAYNRNEATLSENLLITYGLRFERWF